MTTDLTGILRRTALLRSVPDEDLKAVIAASRLRAVRRGQVCSSPVTLATRWWWSSQAVSRWWFAPRTAAS